MLKRNIKLVPYLNTLLLRNCDLSSLSAKIISDGVGQLKELKTLDLSCNSLDEKDK